jgi:hypothetical protein
MSAIQHPFRPDKAFLEVPANYPFPSTSGAVPPLLLCSHWDPTMIISRILPDQTVAMPLSFRPQTKICLDYVTTAPPEPLPATGQTLFPPGGQIYPPNRYAAAIDQESLLRRQDRPLGTCEKDQYRPSFGGDLYRSAVPINAPPLSSRMIEELAMPKAAIITEPYNCRYEQDRLNLALSSLPFNNSTKTQRYKSYKQSQAF